MSAFLFQLRCATWITSCIFFLVGIFFFRRGGFKQRYANLPAQGEQPAVKHVQYWEECLDP